MICVLRISKRVDAEGLRRRMLVVGLLAKHPEGVTTEGIRALLHLGTIQAAQSMIRTMVDEGILVRSTVYRPSRSMQCGFHRRKTAIHRLHPDMLLGAPIDGPED